MEYHAMKLLWTTNKHYSIPRRLDVIQEAVRNNEKSNDPFASRRVRVMPATPNATNTHKSLFYKILQQPDTTITTDTTGSHIDEID